MLVNYGVYFSVWCCLPLNDLKCCKNLNEVGETRREKKYKRKIAAKGLRANV